MAKLLYVTNSLEEQERFSLKKVYRSARRVGASKGLAQKIVGIISREAYPGIATSEIFDRINSLLYQKQPQAALRFNLKKAMKRLGPSGFPFEKFAAKILASSGFEIQLNQYIQGYCCLYETDVLAKKGNILYLVECKYRNQPGGIVHLNNVLANQAKFLDILKGGHCKKVKLRSLLVTNSKFTDQAIKYSQCVGMELLGWSYPRKNGLEHIIDRENLYPITVLPSLKPYLADVFVSNNIMLVKDLLGLDINRFLKETGISIRQLRPLMEEAKILIES